MAPISVEVVDRKILQLLDRRSVVSNAFASLGGRAAGHWRSSAIRIQRAVYEIDYHFEENRTVSCPTLDYLWSRVEAEVAVASDRSEGPWYWLEQLRAYERFELRIHDGDWIEPGELRRVVETKISDVALARSLICAVGGAVPPVSEVRFWRYYDQCSEVMEDVVDMEEDIGTWNLNVWLYPAKSGRPLLSGIGHARALLRELLESLTSSYADLNGATHHRMRPYFDAICSVGTHVLDGAWYRNLDCVRERIIRYSDLPPEVCEESSRCP